MDDIILPLSNPSRASLETVATEPEEPYWEEEGWVPLMKNGKQRTPNQIRNEMQKYIDNSDQSAASILQELGVTPSSFYKFMNPGNYKDQWNAIQNQSYWEAAKFLEAQRNKPKSKKRKAAPSKDDSSNKKAKEDAKTDALDLLTSIQNYPTNGINERVYDSCPELVKKTKKFLEMDGLTKKDFCTALGVQAAQLNKFLASKKQDAAGTAIYPKLWTFFEKKRQMEGAPKSKQRLRNEQERGFGFCLTNPKKKCWVVLPNW